MAAWFMAVNYEYELFLCISDNGTYIKLSFTVITLSIGVLALGKISQIRNEKISLGEYSVI
jgi:hypothetical protein